MHASVIVITIHWKSATNASMLFSGLSSVLRLAGRPTYARESTRRYCTPIDSVEDPAIERYGSK